MVQVQVPVRNDSLDACKLAAHTDVRKHLRTSRAIGMVKADLWSDCGVLCGTARPRSLGR